MQDENPYCKLTVPISLQFVLTDILVLNENSF